MRLVAVLCVLVSLSVMSVSLAARQGHHASIGERGAKVMGFDQELTAHHFLLFKDGGAIDVNVKTPSDSTARNAIRSHLPHIAAMFSGGNFDAPMLVHDSRNVPGTETMAARRDVIRYHYVETPTGGRVDIVTTDAEALAAVHSFLMFQIVDHQTGDPTTVRAR